MRLNLNSVNLYSQQDVYMKNIRNEKIHNGNNNLQNKSLNDIHLQQQYQNARNHNTDQQNKKIFTTQFNNRSGSLQNNNTSSYGIQNTNNFGNNSQMNSQSPSEGINLQSTLIPCFNCQSQIKYDEIQAHSQICVRSNPFVDGIDYHTAIQQIDNKLEKVNNYLLSLLKEQKRLNVKERRTLALKEIVQKALHTKQENIEKLINEINQEFNNFNKNAQDYLYLHAQQIKNVIQLKTSIISPQLQPSQQSKPQSQSNYFIVNGNSTKLNMNQLQQQKSHMYMKSEQTPRGNEESAGEMNIYFQSNEPMQSPNRLQSPQQSSIDHITKQKNNIFKQGNNNNSFSTHQFSNYLSNNQKPNQNRIHNMSDHQNISANNKIDNLTSNQFSGINQKIIPFNTSSNYQNLNNKQINYKSDDNNLLNFKNINNHSPNITISHSPNKIQQNFYQNNNKQQNNDYYIHLNNANNLRQPYLNQNNQISNYQINNQTKQNSNTLNNNICFSTQVESVYNRQNNQNSQEQKYNFNNLGSVHSQQSNITSNSENKPKNMQYPYFSNNNNQLNQINPQVSSNQVDNKTNSYQIKINQGSKSPQSVLISPQHVFLSPQNNRLNSNSNIPESDILLNKNITSGQRTFKSSRQIYLDQQSQGNNINNQEQILKEGNQLLEDEVKRSNNQNNGKQNQPIQQQNASESGVSDKKKDLLNKLMQKQKDLQNLQLQSQQHRQIYDNYQDEINRVYNIPGYSVSRSPVNNQRLKQSNDTSLQTLNQENKYPLQKQQSSSQNNSSEITQSSFMTPNQVGSINEIKNDEDKELQTIFFNICFKEKLNFPKHHIAQKIPVGLLFKEAIEMNIKDEEQMTYFIQYAFENATTYIDIDKVKRLQKNQIFKNNLIQKVQLTTQ